MHEVYEALVLGTRDYVQKNGFADVFVGLSGGIDSSLVAAIAADALGPEHVTGVLMPSRYSSEGSVTDAEALAANLGIRTLTDPDRAGAHRVPRHARRAVRRHRARAGRGEPPGADPRHDPHDDVATSSAGSCSPPGNKSEMATGYATLYGDMAGGFAVIKDVPKMLVYALARDRNERAGRALIPDVVLEKPPSAELRPDQKDSDSLPEYACSTRSSRATWRTTSRSPSSRRPGYDADTVRRVARLVDRNEYKRRQAPPGVRVSPKAFGKDRRLPITNRWPG